MVLFPNKKRVTEKRTKGGNLLNPYLLTVLMSIPFSKSPCLNREKNVEFINFSHDSEMLHFGIYSET